MMGCSVVLEWRDVATPQLPPARLRLSHEAARDGAVPTPRQYSFHHRVWRPPLRVALGCGNEPVLADPASIMHRGFAGSGKERSH